MIVEPQRAFSGTQFEGILLQFAHYGVGLWVPELGGPVDIDNDGHYMALSNYGTMSRAERNRTRLRVANAMRAHAQAGRWLGGRPPYGYRIADAGPHPNPSKAASGARLHQLAPDPETAPVVRRIFDMYLAGAGYKQIAAVLTNEGIPSPSAHDPKRNSHRPGHSWAMSAVRAILTNPRYLGHQVSGRTKKKDVLLDPDVPALGHVTRQQWQQRERVGDLDSPGIRRDRRRTDLASSPSTRGQQHAHQSDDSIAPDARGSPPIRFLAVPPRRTGHL